MLLNALLCRLDQYDENSEGELIIETSSEGDSPVEAISEALKQHPMQFIMPTLDPATGNVYGVVLNDVMLNAFENLQRESIESSPWSMGRVMTKHALGSSDHRWEDVDEDGDMVPDTSSDRSEVFENTSSDWAEDGASEEEASLLRWKEEHTADFDSSFDEISSQSSLVSTVTRSRPWAIEPQVEFVYVPLSDPLAHSHSPDAEVAHPLKCHHKVTVTIEELPRLSQHSEDGIDDENALAQLTASGEEETDAERDLRAGDRDNDLNLPSQNKITNSVTVTQTVYETVEVHTTVTSENSGNPYQGPSKPDFMRKEYRMMRVADNELIETLRYEVPRPRRYRAGKGILHD